MSPFLTLLTKFFGYYPASLKSSQSLRVKFVLYNISFLALTSSLAIYALYVDYKASFKKKSLRMKSNTAIIVTTIEIFFLILSSSVIMIRFTRNRFDMSRIEHDLNKVEQKLHCRSKHSCHKMKHILDILFMAFHMLVILIDMYYWHVLEGNIRYYYVCHLFTLGIITFQLIYSDLTFRITNAFLHTNALFMRYFKTNQLEEKELFYFETPLFPNRIKKHMPPSLVSIALSSYANIHLDAKLYSLSEIISVHTTLCASVHHVNETYGIILLVVLLSTCFHFTITPYFFFLNLFYPAVYGTADFGFLILQIVWILTYFFQLLILIVPASRASQEAYNTGVILCEFLSKDLSYSVLNQMETMIIQLSNSTCAEFSACGLMKLKLATLTTIVGTVATYLVILIQFQNADKINQA